MTKKSNKTTKSNVNVIAEVIETRTKSRFGFANPAGLKYSSTVKDVEVMNRESNFVQNRCVGSRAERNEFGHTVGSIGAKIDHMIKLGNFDKKQMITFAGTKISKVNNHINHLRKDLNVPVIIDKMTGKVSIAS